MTATAQALIDRYRCPEAFVNLPLRGRLSETAGFFRFGPGITCYGRSSAGTRARSAQPLLYDASNDVGVENSELLLPFNPTEIIDNLRWEGYVRPDSRIRTFAKRAYYSLRPFLSDAARRRYSKGPAEGLGQTDISELARRHNAGGHLREADVFVNARVGCRSSSFRMVLDQMAHVAAC